MFDTINDLAVLAVPDDPGPRHAFNWFTAIALTVAAPPPDHTDAWVLSLDRKKWLPCRVRNEGRLLIISDVTIARSMVGSPIVAEGNPIGVVSLGGGGPCLAACLPVWLWRELRKAVRHKPAPRGGAVSLAPLSQAQLDALPERLRRRLLARVSGEKAD